MSKCQIRVQLSKGFVDLIFKYYTFIAVLSASSLSCSFFSLCLAFRASLSAALLDTKKKKKRMLQLIETTNLQQQQQQNRYLEEFILCAYLLMLSAPATSCQQDGLRVPHHTTGWPLHSCAALCNTEHLQKHRNSLFFPLFWVLW